MNNEPLVDSIGGLFSTSCATHATTSSAASPSPPSRRGGAQRFAGQPSESLDDSRASGPASS